MKETEEFLRLTCVPPKGKATGLPSHPTPGLGSSRPSLSFERARERMKQLTPSERQRLEKLLTESRAAARKDARKSALIVPFATEGSA